MKCSEKEGNALLTMDIYTQSKKAQVEANFTHLKSGIWFQLATEKCKILSPNEKFMLMGYSRKRRWIENKHSFNLELYDNAYAGRFCQRLQRNAAQ